MMSTKLKKKKKKEVDWWFNNTVNLAVVGEYNK